MPQVFISYRQTDDPQRQRVRAFGQRLRDCGIDVVLDQFFLDANPAGPNDGWDKWSSDRALETQFVLIIGTEAWFLCFEKKQRPGTGLGAACEADDLRQRIYKAGGINDNIRVVLFDDDDAKRIPAKLERYHRFHADKDFEAIVKWLGGTLPAKPGSIDHPAKSSIPHNLPHLQPFFGREDELARIAEALDPDNRTWGALIDGPGGMGKTSLAVRAAYDASPDAFEKIVFVSLQTRRLDDDGVCDLSGFLISGLLELFNELARELGAPDIAKAPEDQRARLLLDALRGTRTLLLLDNLESLTRDERGTVFTFVKKLPPGCKAILTSRGRIGSGAEELILEKLSESAALATLAELATRNPLLARTSEAERIALYRETSGKPLLLRWTAGQLGRGHCLTFADALAFLRSCPPKNDPLEFIFGDLVEDFTAAEMQALSALTYFTLPAKVEHVAEIVAFGAASAGPPVAEVETALKSLAVRSLAVPDLEARAYTLVPLVADFLRKKKPELVAETGDRLEKRTYALVMENGWQKHDRFPVLDAAWPTVAAALPRFLAGENDRLQDVCDALDCFLEFTGRWDEWLALSRDAEARAVAAGDFWNAGWRAQQAGWVHYLRGQAAEVLACADRAEGHWGGAASGVAPSSALRAPSPPRGEKGKAGARERAYAICLRGLGHRLARDYPAAIAAYREAVELLRTLSPESDDVTIGLNALANAENDSGDLDAARRDYHEALRIAKAVGDRESIAMITGNLAALALDREDWPGAEALAREALALAEQVGRQELIASNSRRLAQALLHQAKPAEALPYAQRAVDIFTRLRHPNLEAARKTLRECEG